MPKPTFYNLAESKKKVLMEAAEAEFSRVALSEASIANIVKMAKVPRGSFYQYFEDKEDAYFFLLEEHAKRRQINFITFLKQTNGDIFETMREMYCQTISNATNKGNLHFVKNALLNMNHKIENTFEKIFIDTVMEDHLDEVRSLINKGKLNIEHESDLSHIMKILTVVTLRNLIETFAKDLTYKEAVHNYTAVISLLKRGLSK